MRKNVFLLIVSLALTFTACNKVKTDIENGQFVLNTNTAALQDRVSVVNEPLDFVTSTTKSTAVTYSLQNIWNVAPALTTQSASSVAIDGTDVYVGFHVRGNTYNGEILKVSQSSTLTLASWGLSSTLVDINDLEYNASDNALYIAGESDKRGAEALMINLASSGVSNTPSTLGMPIFGASGNSVTRITAGTNELLWVSAGGTQVSNSQGGLMELDLAATTPADPSTIKLANEAKQFDSDGAYGLWIYGNGSYTFFNVFNALTNTTKSLRQAYTSTIINKPVTDYGKNAVDVKGTVGYVAMGAAGAYKIDLAGVPGATLATYYDAANLGLANGIATDGTYVYVAHGADGLIVLKASDMSEVGRWNGTTRSGTTEFNNGSCNYVAVGATTGTTTDLFVAFGTGGLMKLQFTVTP